MKSRINPTLLLMVFFLAFFSLACSIPQAINIYSQNINSKTQTSINNTATPLVKIPGVPFTITLTEADVNKWFSEQVNSTTEKYIAKPKIYLRNGYIEIDGVFSQGTISNDVVIKFQLAMDENGKILINLISANFGTFPVPAEIINTFFNTIDINNLINSSDQSLRIEKIDVTDGLLRISGHKEK